MKRKLSRFKILTNDLILPPKAGTSPEKETDGWKLKHHFDTDKAPKLAHVRTSIPVQLFQV